jgi:hypothetical protein
MQGPGGDWHTEAPKMASIYRNALFTVAFVDGTSLTTAAKTVSDNHFVSGLDIQSINPGRSPTFDAENPESIYTWLERNGNFVARPDGELDTRAWTFQERLLSRRILSVTRAGLFWDCLSHSASDRRPLGIRGDFSPKFRDSDDRKLRVCLLTGGGADGDSDVKPSIASQYALWRRALQDYTTRKLSVDSDRVIAIEGITQQMSQFLGDECVLGIWRSDGPRSLIWFVEPTSPAMIPGEFLRNDPAVIAPSWSWASVNLPIQYCLWHPFARYLERSTESYIPCCKIESLYAGQNNGVSFDSYSGEICITGALARVETVGLQTASGCQVILDPRPAGWFPEIRDELHQNNKIFFQSIGQERYQSVVLGKHFFVLPIMEGGYSASLRAQYCLILQLIERQAASEKEPCTSYRSVFVKGKYRRLGLFILDRAVSSICVNDPSTCMDEKCAQEFSAGGDMLRMGKRCRGNLSMVRIV